MKDSENFYMTDLYPFQDGVIRILRTLGTPFFLTGGTALARAYLGHRALPSAPNVSSFFPCCAATFS
jgi:hypothetical protein